MRNAVRGGFRILSAVRGSREATTACNTRQRGCNGAGGGNLVGDDQIFIAASDACG
jgi:hypothetical protein